MRTEGDSACEQRMISIVTDYNKKQLAARLRRERANSAIESDDDGKAEEDEHEEDDEKKDDNNDEDEEEDQKDEGEYEDEALADYTQHIMMR